MFCSRCQNPVYACECGDIEERLAKLAQHPNFATDRCKHCQRHPQECACEAYEPFESDAVQSEEPSP